jgi:DNA-binding IclR family transcriptional regulator
VSKALENGIAVLEHVSSKRACTITEIAAALGINKSTVSRIIQTFIRKDMIERSRVSGMYSIGPAILQMSSRYYKVRNLAGQVKSAMEAVCRQVEESVHLCALSNDGAVVVEQVESASRLVVNARIGNREPLHASSVGKCLLAYAEENERQAMLANIRYERYTANTILSQEKLLEELESIRAKGYSIDDNELSNDIRCVAVPVFDSRGRCVYSLGVSGANSHMTTEKIHFIVEKLQMAVRPLMETI